MTWRGERSVERDPLFAVFLCLSPSYKLSRTKGENLWCNFAVFVHEKSRAPEHVKRDPHVLDLVLFLHPKKCLTCGGEKFALLLVLETVPVLNAFSIEHGFYVSPNEERRFRSFCLFVGEKTVFTTPLTLLLTFPLTSLTSSLRIRNLGGFLDVQRYLQNPNSSSFWHFCKF